MILIETNIDDISSEKLGSDFQEALLKNGAIDFYFTSIQMKKGRPGLKLSVLVATIDLERTSAFILEQTSSIGVRHYRVDRSILTREEFEVDTQYGRIKVKQVTTPSGAKRHKIEFESLRKLKDLHNIPIFQLEQELYPLLSHKMPNYGKE